MKRLRSSLAYLLCLALVLQPAMVPAASQKKGVDAAGLLKSAERGLSRTIKAARASKDPALSPDKAGGKPFWQALKKLNGALDKTERGLSLQDKTFFRGLSEAVSAATEADAAYGLSGASDAEVKKSLETTRNAVTLLERRYGKGASRLKKGGQLSAAESRQLEKMREKQAELKRKLDEVERKAKLNEEELKRLRDLRSYSDRIDRSRSTVGDFVAALFFMRVIDGLLWGCHWWWGPWGIWVGPFSGGFGSIYYSSVEIIEYDWIVVDELVTLEELDDVMDAADVAEVLELAEIPAEADAAEIEAMDDYVEGGDFMVDEQDRYELADTDPAEFDAALESAQTGELAPGPAEPELDAPDLPGESLPEAELPVESLPVEEPPFEAVGEPIEAPMLPEAVESPFPEPALDAMPMDSPMDPGFGEPDLPVDDFGGDMGPADLDF